MKFRWFIMIVVVVAVIVLIFFGHIAGKVSDNFHPTSAPMESSVQSSQPGLSQIASTYL